MSAGYYWDLLLLTQCLSKIADFLLTRVWQVRIAQVDEYEGETSVTMGQEDLEHNLRMSAAKDSVVSNFNAIVLSQVTNLTTPSKYVQLASNARDATVVNLSDVRMSRADLEEMFGMHSYKQRFDDCKFAGVIDRIFQTTSSRHLVSNPVHCTYTC